MMDAFEIDMELLRRIAALKTAAHAAHTDLDAVPSLLSAASSAAERAGDEAPEVRRAFELLPEVWAGNEEAAARLAPATAAFADAIEQAVLAETAAEQASLAAMAAGTLLVAVGRDPSEWDAHASPDFGSNADDATAETTAGETDTPTGLPCDTADLHRLASHLIQLDPEDREQLAQLRDDVRSAFADAPEVPAGVAEAVEEISSALEGARWSARRREAADRGLDQLGLELEELARQAETIQLGAVEPAEVIEPSAEPLELELATPAIEPADPAPEVQLAAEAVEATQPADSVSTRLSGTPVVVPAAADPDLLEDFLGEGSDHLDQAESALLVLESNPGDLEAVNVVFRAFHTIKGVAGFLELHVVTEVAHHAESLLSQVRDGKLVFSSSVADLTLRSSDLLRELLDGVRAAASGDSARIPGAYDEIVDILQDSDHIDRLAAGEVLRLEVVEGSDEEAEQAGASSAAAEHDASVRVKTARLDRLLDLVGELVVSHSMVAEDPALDHRSNLARKIVRSDKILRELQDLTTSMRMVPMKPAFRKATRVVRDVSRRAGKTIELITGGEDTELDRSMVDLIADPLVHMVRNAIDHGIESPEERRAAGKPETGRLTISAGQLGGSVVIEIADDGRGLDRDRILEKARSRGIIDSDRGMSDADIHALIFAPGFSTAEQVTDISGRGVGMDVVRRSVESLRGRIDIESTPGEGSRFSIHLPLTLAITDGMLLRVGGERFIIPMVKIQSSVRPSLDDLYSVAGKGEMAQLHGELLPVVRLGELYEVPNAETNPAEALLVVVGEGTRCFAMMVDEILGQQQFVVKALTGHAAETPGVAGGAILGDGEVGLILDPDEILTLARRSQVAVA